MKDISIIDFIQSFKDAVNFYKDNSYNGVHFWYLPSYDDKPYHWAIVLGWSDGFEPDHTDVFSDETWHLCAKIAYQPTNSLMQCDYEVDWLMPYDEDTGHVIDTEYLIFEDSFFERICEDMLAEYAMIAFPHLASFTFFSELYHKFKNNFDYLSKLENELIWYEEATDEEIGECGENLSKFLYCVYGDGDIDNWLYG